MGEVERVVRRIWNEIVDKGIVFCSGPYNRITGESSPPIPYLDKNYRLRQSRERGSDFERKISERILNAFAKEDARKYDPVVFIRRLGFMIHRLCIRHFNTSNQHALADAMSADLCPVVIRWYDDMVILEIKDERHRT